MGFHGYFYSNIKVKIAIKPHLTVDKFFASPKDPLNERDISGIVYQIPYHECKFTYIGLTNCKQFTNYMEGRPANF